MPVWIGQGKSDRHDVEEATASLVLASKVRADVESELVVSRREGITEEHRALGAAVKVGDCRGQVDRRIPAESPEFDGDACAWATLGGIEDVGCQPSRHMLYP